MIEHFFYQDNHGFHQILINDGTGLFDYSGMIAGRVDGNKIAPIFNGAQKTIRIDRNHNDERFIMDEDEVRNWRVFQCCDDFNKRVSSIYRETQLMNINSKPENS